MNNSHAIQYQAGEIHHRTKCSVKTERSSHIAPTGDSCVWHFVSMVFWSVHHIRYNNSVYVYDSLWSVQHLFIGHWLLCIRNEYSLWIVAIVKFVCNRKKSFRIISMCSIKALLWNPIILCSNELFVHLISLIHPTTIFTLRYEFDERKLQSFESKLGSIKNSKAI